jgi:hypothetical protein
MIFTTIEAAPGLSATERRRVAGAGPSAVLTRTSYAGLLASAGFADIDHTDVTAEYRETQQAWTEAMRRRAAGIGAAMGRQAFEQRLADREAALAAVDDGLLRRSRYSSIRA